MGLDISYCSHLNLLDQLTGGLDQDRIDRANLILLYNSKDYAHRAAEFEVIMEKDTFVYYGGFFFLGRRGRFPVGPYSHFCEWLDELASRVHGTDARVIMRDRDRFHGKSFFELIDFPTTEGTIGTAVSRKLARDFETYLIEPTDVAEDDEWFWTIYREFAHAFDCAGSGGAVKFH